MSMGQVLIVYGPVERPVVYTTAAADPDAARLQRWEAQQRYPRETVRITDAEVVTLPAETEP